MVPEATILEQELPHMVEVTGAVMVHLVQEEVVVVVMAAEVLV
jgi:hypothetical protein